jgi:hypothetical protein
MKMIGPYLDFLSRSIATKEAVNAGIKDRFR